jgi:O-antigen biosynthesis protein
VRPTGIRRRPFIGRVRRLVPKAARDVERTVDGRWAVHGPKPLVGLVPEDGGPLSTGDVRVDIEMSGTGDAVHTTLVLDTGEGFARGVRLPLPRARSGSVSFVVTLPPSTLGIALDLGTAETFALGAVSLMELSGVGAVLAHGMPQLSRMLRSPGQLAVILGRALRLLRYRGPRGVLERLRRGTQRQLSDEGYEGWALRYGHLSEAQRGELRNRLEVLGHGPTFSLLLKGVRPLDARDESLRRTLGALERQSYAKWEVCLADEDVSTGSREQLEALVGPERVRWAKGRDGLSVARGDLVAHLEAGDSLEEDALLAVAEVVAREPDVALVYTDSDGPDAVGHIVPAFRPEWSPELLRSWDYVGRTAFLRTDRVRALAEGAFAPQHAVLLRYTSQLPAARIAHLPFVLLHTRAERPADAKDPLIGLRSVQASLDAVGAGAHAEPGRRAGTYHVRYAVPSPPPPVTVIIPTKDKPGLLERCVESLQGVTGYWPLELLIVDNDSRERRTRVYLKYLEGQGVARVLPFPNPFNFSAMNNLAAREARGDVLCLLNNDVEATSAGWLSEMVGLALQPDVGAVGAKLLYPDGTVQHAGTVAGLFGVAAHGYLREAREADGYLFQLQSVREVSAVTAACLVMRRELYLKVGGLDEAELPVAFNDVDLCFRLLKAGYRNVWTPYAELVHRESASRGTDERGADRQRFLQEEAVMRGRWGALIANDPYYSPNLSLDSNVPRPAWPPRTVWPWMGHP